ncbi:MAG: NUDIX domain-containing protein [Bacteroidetes bacterium]|nr:NUDIX domain-containing protein [Bacteroidota bacterium]
MKIFLNDRIIEFVAVRPEQTFFSDMVVDYQSTGQIKEAWGDFQRYEKFRNFLIVDPELREKSNSSAVEAFFSLFKIVYAAGGLVKNEKGEFLFIHRLGFWDLPKGKIDKKDIPGPEYSKTDLASASAAAIREVKEETGLQNVVINKQLAATWHIYAIQEKWMLKKMLKKTQWFEMQADSGQKLTPETSEGIFLVKWTSPDAIHCIMSHTYASIRELLLEVLF